MNCDELIDQALTAHEETLEAQGRLTELARDRDTAIRQALEAGASGADLARALGLTRQRVYAMAKQR
ncbi:hypothetical protein [Glutamicibacter ardleyensis]|uniref:hypothetical protein n=1 Tax=Glutamicibacter ardleyensis TaxID=225894 RepID=UPI003FD356CF